MQIPAALEAFRAQLLATERSFIRIKSGEPKPLQPWQSKVGGTPYLPKSVDWPVGPEGQPLFFLAQLNFAEMPALPPFPQKGIVSFFINDDDLYGMDFDDGENPDTFRVLFFPDVVTDVKMLQSPALPHDDEYDLLPHHPEETYPLTFSIEKEIVPATDYHFNQYFGADFFRQFGDQEWDTWDQYNKMVRAQGHKAGGYAYFTQDDPRRAEDPMILLFQLDSDEQMDLMWGDMGIGHFFIRENDLIEGNFSRVLYDWDCL
jgi:uncharacterized protein YwqG